MKSLILGVGEIGQSYYEILNPAYPQTYRLDILPERSDKKIPSEVDILHVCLRYSSEWFNSVTDAILKYRPDIVNVMSTVPPGETEKLGDIACHSTTRGLHPNLKAFIEATPKHIGGPKAEVLAKYFRDAGLECITHPKAKTTEAAHILSNLHYMTSIMFAREMESACRAWGVDYFDSVMKYSDSHNQGYSKMGYISKFRPIIHPPGKEIGGHCLVPHAKMIPEEIRGPIMRLLADEK
jgi:UDP-N-acetyl-D-mannosaminuronate dehydrogenase